MPGARRLLIDVTVILAIGLVLALLGPFGSFAAPFALRLAFWLALPLAGYFLYMPATALALRLSDRLDLPSPALWIASWLVASLPMAVVIWASGTLLGEPEPLDAAGFLGGYGQALVIGGPIMLLLWSMRRPPSPIAATAPAPPPEAPQPPRFLTRLPPHLGTDLLALEMEDHYVRAHTALGSTLILMRMRDAVAELDGIAGLQVHRSWWVARAALAEAVRDGREARLTLINGLAVPVSRTNLAAVRDAGWLR